MSQIEQPGRRVLRTVLTRLSPALPLVAGLLYAAPAMAAAETFGPGLVSCQTLVGERTDCLLSASRITEDNRNEASFSLTDLESGPRELFSKWCLHPADECTVTVVGERGSPQATRLSTVTSLKWQRPRAPRDQDEASAAP